ncbi:MULTISPECIES: hypothetical protein [Rhodopseudomonas]|nr:MULTISPECIES: hypothetical protein [Rhodopseudomonas]MDF3809292.1 hypothetical protein [Rhodopseudomonas sp. BAL398]WOK19025.1 hypothetical protein RBJ75_05765 [Rhodopseudomonas sp. BAL398]
MSAERNGGAWSFQCDSCTEHLDTNERGFEAALSEAKSEGWQPYLALGHWNHACPNCKECRS